MKNLIRLDGIYNYETLDAARSMGVQSFQFDFRPRSLNFLQLHVFQEMVENLPKNKETFFNYVENNKNDIFKYLELSDFEAQIKVS